jgi:hypothetical protein
MYAGHVRGVSGHGLLTHPCVRMTNFPTPSIRTTGLRVNRLDRLVVAKGLQPDDAGVKTTFKFTPGDWF